MEERIAPEQHDTLEGIVEPSENPHLFGHGEAAAMLAATYQTGKMPHALLLSGPQGIGKATFAFHLAHHLLKHPLPAGAPASFTAPDTSSSLFRQVAMGAHPSVLHLTRPVNDRTKNFKTVLTVDEIRRVSRFLSMTAHDGGYRIVIVDPADDMNTNAANALLKNLEEPPARTLFVLIVHSAGGLLPTIRSRCQTVRLEPLGAEDLLSAMQGIGAPLPVDPAARDALVRQAGGSPRTAILLSQHGGLEIAEAIDGIANARKMDVARAHRLADIVGGRDQAIAFGIFNRHALDVLSTAASSAARSRDLGRANLLSEAWHEALVAISETETYNLDRKQYALTMIDRLNAAMRM